uniref:Uncharacterized protein n=1 Tax=Opuntia streptacantha TaxID=393608 RepID=A0A7C9EA43_OPUST
MLIRTSRGIFVSSGKQARSKKHSLTLSDRNEMLVFILSSKLASWDSPIGSPRESLLFALVQNIWGWPRNEAPMTLRAKGSPLHSRTSCLTNCSSTLIGMEFWPKAEWQNRVMD